MRDKIVKNLEARFGAYADLIDQTDDDGLQKKLDVEKHKSLAEHLWCIVGARESYAKALAAGKWEGFGCSLASFSQSDFRDTLNKSAQDVLTAIRSIDDWTDEREELLATLAEHEVMHEGQIIRHIYGSGSSAPSSWKWA
jgi:uncharacterized damage-inducible protein DinB